jgi:protein-tyrosine phosphatase
LLLEVWRIAAHARVEIACSGGVGRTGAALAVLAVADGVAPEQAIGWVRERHHRRAVETPGQRRWVRSLRAPAP